MQNKESKFLWLIPCFMLASLLCAGYVSAQDNDQPQTGKEQGEDKIQKRSGTIFDDQADEFEEPTYTPPTDIDEKAESLKIPPDVRKYLSDKYSNIRKTETYSTLKQTQYGPSGRISLSYNRKPGWDSPLKKGENREERARSLAIEYMKEEAGLLGIIDIEEFHESRINTDKGYGGDYTYLDYHRFINGLELKNSYITFTIGPDETIYDVDSNVFAPPPALYHAIAKKTIGRGKAFRTVRDDLKSSDSDVSVGISKAHKEAILDPPYVIWYVEARSFKLVNGQPRDWQWEYKLDAFTGEIIQKRNKPMASGANPR